MHYNRPLGHYAKIIDEMSIHFGLIGRVMAREELGFRIELVDQNVLFKADQFVIIDCKGLPN